MTAEELIFQLKNYPPETSIVASLDGITFVDVDHIDSRHMVKTLKRNIDDQDLYKINKSGDQMIIIF